MKKLIYCLAIAAFMTISVESAQAQLLGLNHSISLLGLLPAGEFGDDVTLADDAFPVFGRENIAKDAGVGIGISYRLAKQFDIMVGDLAPFAELGLLRNTVSKGNREAFENQRSTSPKYLNLPIFVGLQYRHDLMPMVKPFAEFGLGTDILFITKEGDSGKGAHPYYVYKPSSAFAWQIGAGAYVGGLVSASITYYGFGRHGIDYNTKRTYDPNDDNFAANANKKTEFRNIGCVALKVSFHF